MTGTMPVDAAAGRAAAGVLARAYARSVRTMRKNHRLDVKAALRRRDSNETVAIVVEDMVGTLIFYLLAAMLLATPVLMVSGSIGSRIIRCVVVAAVIVPALVPLAGLVIVQFWAVHHDWRSRRAEKPLRLSPADIEALLARGGLVTWRLALVLGLVAALALAWEPVL